MHSLVFTVISAAAEAAGLPEGRVFDLAKKDNLTQPRPRIEVQFLPEKLSRTGRILAVSRNSEEQTRKRELYDAELLVVANVLAEDEAWLGDFCYAFLAALPRGVNDSRGNWVRIRAAKAEFGRKTPPRVGTQSIEVFTKVNQLISLTFTYRITSEEREDLIQTITIHHPLFGG